MYYVNMEQIERRLKFVGDIVNAIDALLPTWENGERIHHYAQERILHLAIECVTDVCSYVIDGLMMREASSYEDLVDILYEEQVYSSQTRDVLLALVALRRPLVQHYYEFERGEQPHPLLQQLPAVLTEWVEKIKRFLADELRDFT